MKGRLRPRGLIVLLGALSAFGPLTIDMYLPAMPDMAAELETSTIWIQATPIAFVAVLAISQLAHGSNSARRYRVTD